LIQKDKRTISFWIQPNDHEVSTIIISWRLLARDFNVEGKIDLKVAPKFERSMHQVEVDEAGLRDKEESFSKKSALKKINLL
jgi:hypothetical protein